MKEEMLSNYIGIKFCFVLGTGTWTQGLHLEPLHQSFFVMGFFQDRVSRTIFPGWLQTKILLISASWVAGLQAWATGARPRIKFLKELRM
jgi:hypothetical protein